MYIDVYIDMGNINTVALTASFAHAWFCHSFPSLQDIWGEKLDGVSPVDTRPSPPSSTTL